MSDTELLKIFGHILMTTVRDRSIERFENISSGTVKAKYLLELHNLIENFTLEQREILRKLVVESIDNVIFNLLDMLEQNEDSMKLLLSENNGSERNIINISDGLSGELFTDDGWIEQFSKYK
ncbi:hypothetical protein CE143_16020 [Photorhabdus luminescens]|uniref:Uncharacterized protein n=1 Tax=Photorhabdus akhurstii TaxID=171438 RepID=A0ABX8LY90_9GAMM|nr:MULTISPECIES: hypothetical protein [Photorhabdus]MBS9429831.1 hypothetical protein [Photorhabdus akhurstii]MBS9435560.1 hypothetical protein [Photorhabdus hainanensis]QXF34491.1 hypothetical protein B0X70_16025 [Photorhabdus akhurstii]UJD76315.1 hypothetical protein CE143_16020 [Photorhabdus luminescens]